MEGMRLLFLALASSVALWLAPAPSSACGFNEIVAGDCDFIEFKTPSRSNNRYAFYSDVAWTKWPEFERSKGPIVLNVCLFRTSPSLIFKSGATLGKFTNQQSLNTIGEQIEIAASEWTAASIVAGDRTTRSRLSFSFRDNSGNYKDCETTRNPHILIAVNLSNTNISAIGTSQLEEARRSNPPLGTMTLSVANGRVLPDAVSHEFGHALGFLHEMAHSGWSNCAEAFDAAAYVDTSGYSFGSGYTREEQIELAINNIVKLNEKYKGRTEQSPTFERISRMGYPIEAKYFSGNLGKQCGFDKKVRKLSDLDVRGYLNYYGAVFK